MEQTMFSKTTLHQYLLPVLLILSMMMTRSSHFGSPFSLPDASLAVYFMAGLSGCGFGIFGLLIIEAVLIDYLAISYFGISDFCISPAYNFLLLSYAGMWSGGWISRKYLALGFSDTVKVFAVGIFATTVAYVISNGSFYVISGNFGELTWSGYFEQFCRYYSMYVVSTSIYIMSALGLLKLSYLIRHTVIARS
jgi:hypothetical protein